MVETILSTRDEKGKVNAAPMGLWRKKGTLLYVKPYKTTQTYKNLTKVNLATINILRDVELFYRTTFNSGNLEPLFDREEKARIPPLKGADAYIEVSVEKIRESRQQARITLLPENIKVLKQWPKAFCRCDYAVIESLIHATRIKVFLQQGKRKRVKKLLRLINHYQELIGRVCAKQVHAEIMEKLSKKLRKWRKRM